MILIIYCYIGLKTTKSCCLWLGSSPEDSGKSCVKCLCSVYLLSRDSPVIQVKDLFTGCFFVNMISHVWYQETLAMWLVEFHDCIGFAFFLCVNRLVFSIIKPRKVDC